MARRMRSPRSLLCLLLCAYGAALDNGLALTPPMGWRSWNCYHGDVRDADIRATVDAMVDRSRLVDGVPTSLLDVGYRTVGVDDGWHMTRPFGVGRLGWDAG